MEYYGVRRNVRGTCEKRYVYTRKQLEVFEGDDFREEGFEGAFSGNDTYDVKWLKDEEEAKRFLIEPSECDSDDPTGSLLLNWYKEVPDECMYMHRHNITTKYIKTLLTPCEKMALTCEDHRLKDLLSKGYSRNDLAYSLKPYSELISEAPVELERNFSVKLKGSKIFINDEELPGSFINTGEVSKAVANWLAR